MNTTDTTFLLGYIEQGIGGAQDPLTPPISISRNGSLAKWRGKMHVLDLRVNDPGLQHNREAFVQTLQKAQTLGIKVVVTLPEYVGRSYPLPPDLPPKKDAPPPPPPPKNYKKPENLVHFRPCYLALPSSVEGNRAYAPLSTDDCLPIIEMAAEYGVEHIIVPVSEPGIFIDPQAEAKFKAALKILTAEAGKRQIKLHLRNGGISHAVFRKLRKESGCGMAFNLGIAHLESEDMIETYRQFRNEITIVMLQQVQSGLDKISARRDAMQKALKDFLAAAKDHQQAIAEKDEYYAEQVLKRWHAALREYYDAARNQFMNLGLFQNGDLNLVPFLKEVRKDIEAGHQKILLVEAVPNTRNTDFVMRNVMPDSFPGSL
ncbi:MAG TPA: hypothetical protein PLK28_02940 [Candidatus Rifleibacterium sp.]|jgi:sugar phosphate isomerase/epimerase|nr:hypothetical protein [Candidatus Rifleibacterium sp.]